MSHHKYLTYILIVILTCVNTFAFAQEQSKRTIIEGVVTDSATKRKLPFVTILIKDTKISAQSDADGAYVIVSNQELNSDSVRFICLGYADKIVKFEKNKINRLNLTLKPIDYEISGVVITGSKTKYRKKGNPAVELVEKLIELNKLTDPRNIYKQYGVERYEKMTLSVHDFNRNITSKKLEFLNQHRDTNQLTGKPSLPLGIRERLVDIHIEGNNKKEQIIAKRSEGIEEKFSQDNIDAYLSMLREEIDIFKPNVYFLTRNFVSPFSPIATDYYKYYLPTDTIEYDGAKCVQLSFLPFDKNSLGFSGRIYVTADSTLFIRGIEMTFPNSMNFNFAYNLTINQSFRQGDKGERLITKDDVYYEFMIFSEKDLVGFDVRHVNTYDNYRFEKDPEIIVQIENTSKEFWRERRHNPISIQEERIDELAQGLRTVPGYKFWEDVIVVLSEEYFHTGKNSKFDIGRFYNFVGYNALDKLRLSFGGVTTPKFSPNFFLEGYAAYGFGDNKFKWNGAAEYSFNKKKRYVRDFPVHSIRAEYTYDVIQLGLKAGQFSRDEIGSLFNRRLDSSLTYMRLYRLIYTREVKDGLSILAIAQHYIQSESSVIKFGDWNGNRGQVTMSELNLRLRYAPGEIILHNGNWRQSIEKNAPVFELSHTIGFKDILGSNYQRNLTEFKFTKRFSLSPFGYLDTELIAGAEWNEIPYIFLRQAPTNSTYFLKRDAFSLMLPLEFMYDQYAQWDATWYLNGYILNKIPLIKRLKLREIISTKGLLGTLTDKNNPAINKTLAPFPDGASAISPTPYVEMSFGVENIFKFFRVDYVQRLTYKDKPGIKDWGILLSVRAKF